MESNGGPSPLLGLMGFWMTMGLISTLALLLGGLYALYCMGRAASGLDRLASAIEEMVRRGDATALRTETQPFVPPVPPAPTASPPVPVVPIPPSTPSTGTSSSESNSERQSDDYSR